MLFKGSDFKIKGYSVIKKISQSCNKEINMKGGTHEEFEYGLSLLTINIFKTIILLLLATYLGILKYTVVYMLCIIALRHFSFGIHLNNGFACLVWGLVDYIGGIYLAKYLNMGIVIRVIFFIISFYLMYLYAPAGTGRRPIGKKQYKPLKENTLVVLSILFILSIILAHKQQTIYANVLSIAMVSQTINVLPITYTIFKMERG